MGENVMATIWHSTSQEHTSGYLGLFPYSLLIGTGHFYRYISTYSCIIYIIILFMCTVSLLPARQMVSYPLGPPFDKRNKVKYDTEELKDFTLCITHMPKVGAKNLFHYSSTKSLIFKSILHHEVNLPNSLIEAQVTTFYLLLPLTFRNGIQHFLPMNNQKFEMQILKDLPYNQFHVLCGYRPGYISML